MNKIHRFLKGICCLAAGLTALLVCTPAAFPHAVAAELAASSTPDLSAPAVYAAMIALQQDYPEGTPFTNENYYQWNGGIYRGGYGCAGFAFMLSDAAFGNLPARYYYDYSQIRVGDILRINNDGHSVIVLAISGDVVTIAEGNYNNSVHWGRKLTMDEINNGQTAYAMTRYPENYIVTGDLNGNGIVDSYDAQLTLDDAVRQNAGFQSNLTAAQMAAVDIDGDGELTTADAQNILDYTVYYTAGISVTWDEIRAGVR